MTYSTNLFVDEAENAIDALERMENVTFNAYQKEAIRLLTQDRRRVIEYATPRQVGKSWLLRLLMNRISNDSHIVFPTYYQADVALIHGIPSGRVHYYGNLTTLREVYTPEIIFCDECVPDDYILNIGATKILSIYTPHPGIRGEPNRVTTADLWQQTFDDWVTTLKPKVEKEWDDVTN